MKFLKIISFSSFLTQIGQKFGPARPLSVTFLVIFALNSTQVFVQPLVFALKGIPHVKYEKNVLLMPVSLLFFTKLGLIWPKFWSKTTPTLIFLAGFY